MRHLKQQGGTASDQQYRLSIHLPGETGRAKETARWIDVTAARRVL
jgi:hypothetical protein